MTSVLLHRDAQTRARTLIVAFPPGFTRPVTGRYRAGEEVLVLSGELRLGDVRLEAGYWAWLPPGMVRRAMRSDRGAVVYAWFSAQNDWERCDDDMESLLQARTEFVGASRVRPRRLRGTGAEDGPGSSAIVAPGERVTGPAELLDLTSLVWHRLEQSQPYDIRPGPALVRWPQQAPDPAGGAR